MSEPRRLYTGDARHVYRPDEAQPAAPAASTPPAGRSISTAQAAGTPAAPVPTGPATPAQPGSYTPRPAAAPRPVDPYAARPAAGSYDAARRSAQVQANARARGGDVYARAVNGQNQTAGRQLNPSQRQEIALRQAQNQNRGTDRYAAYTTSGIDRAAIEARLQARQQAEQAARAAQTEREAQAARMAVPAQQAPQAAPVRHIHRPAAPAAPQAPVPAPQERPAPQPGAAAPAPAPVQDAGRGETSRSAEHRSHSEHHGSSQDRRSHSGGGHGGGKPPKKGKGSASGGGKGGKNGKGKKKLKWWQILLITLLAIALILGGTIFFIIRAIRPAGGLGALGLNSLINTPKEFQGDELNFLMIGIDRTEPDPLHPDDQNVGDGNTDMILWVHFNKNDNSMRMLQIPRDYMCTTDYSVSHNYKINNIAKTQGSGQEDAYRWNMAALCEQVHDMFQIPIDGYVSIHIEDLIEMVDVFGGVSMYIPFDIEYGGSYLPAGYQTLNGAAAEFLLRNRHGTGYENSDIDRLNMQRRFYAALFRRMKEMTVYDLFRHVPAFLNWMETDLSVSDLASFAVSVLKMPSDNIMICQMPVGMGGVMFKDQSVVYPARQADADLLNNYFRENTGPVDASQLQLVDTELESVYGIYPSQLPVTDPNVQFMGDMMRDDQEAQQNNNLDGSGVDYFEEDPAPAADPAA